MTNKSLTETTKNRIKARDGRVCAYCLDTDGPMTLDHVTPESWFTRGVMKGDAHADENLVVCCLNCNSLMRDLDLELLGLYLKKGHGWTDDDVDDMTHRVNAARGV